MSQYLLSQPRMPKKLPVSPLDVSTVISIYPFVIDEEKPTLNGGKYHLDAGSPEEPTVLAVRPASWYRDVDPKQELIEVPTPSILIAESIVRDYCNGIHCCDMVSRMPGIFYVQGEFTSLQVKQKFPEALADANKKQNNWYEELVRQADGLYARSNGNPLAISLQMKVAAQKLGLEKDWLRDVARVAMIRCKACGTLINADIILCPNCKVILDEDRAKKLGLKFAS